MLNNPSLLVALQCLDMRCCKANSNGGLLTDIECTGSHANAWISRHSGAGKQWHHEI